MKLLLLSSLLLVFSFCYSQTAYNINVKVKGLADTKVYLAYYFGEGNYLKDTAQVNNKGELAFQGKKALEQGMYMLVLNNTKLFDFVIGVDQEMLLETDTSDYVTNMKVSGDPDNKAFFNNLLFERNSYKKAAPYIKILQDTAMKSKDKTESMEAFNKIKASVMAHQNDVINSNPKSITSRILKSNHPITIPAPATRADGSIDSTFQLRWYRQHFFDNFNLSDAALLRIPGNGFKLKIDEYLDKLFLQHPDSLQKGILNIVNIAKQNPETYKHVVLHCVIKYQQPKIMGLDEVFVNLYDNYFANGEMNYWANDAMKKNLKDAADRIRRSLVGRRGDNLVMLDLDSKPRSMYDIKTQYTILWIFDPDCGHCREETPKLVSFYNQRKFDIEVYAVSLDSSMAKMNDWIKSMNTKWITVNGPRTAVGPVQDHYDALMTPSLYILDDKKKIIAKKISIENIEDFLTQYERIHKMRSN